MKKYIGKIDLFEFSLGGYDEAIIQCSFEFDLKKKSPPPPLHLLKKSCGGQPSNYFFWPNYKSAG